MLRGLGLSEKYPFRLSYAAKQVVATAPRSKSRLQLRGFSQGTALALLLSQYGLGFRPERSPAGKIELVALPADESQSLWPTGWEHLEGMSPVSIAPKLFAQTLVELKDQKLGDVLEAIGQKTNTPVLLDYAKIERGSRCQLHLGDRRKAALCLGVALDADHQPVVPQHQDLLR